MSSNVTSELVFLQRDPKHQIEKPYKLQYDPGNDLPRKNCVDELREGIVIHDLRGNEHDFTLESNGFCVMKLESQLNPEDFDDDAKIKNVYYNELKSLLKAKLGARRIEILEHGVRKRHHAFPVSTGEDYEYLQPTSVVHVDFTLAAAIYHSEKVLGVTPSDYKRVQVFKYKLPNQIHVIKSRLISAFKAYGNRYEDR